MPRRHRTAVPVMLALLGLLLAAADDAGARRFQMSGTWVYRAGGFFLPAQFATRVTEPGPIRVHQSMGDLSGAYGFPNGPITGGGAVTATASAPAALRVPAHRFVEDASWKNHRATT